MKSRENTLMSICVGLLILEFIMPYHIPFLSYIVLGFMLEFLGLRRTLKTLLWTAAMYSVKSGLRLGAFGFIAGPLLYLFGALILMPMGLLMFHKYRIRERLGY